MAVGLLFDTSVLVCHLRGEDPRCTEYMGQVASGALDGYASVLTLAELYAAERVGRSEELVIDQLLAPFQLVPSSSEVAALAGRLARQWRRSHGLGLVDALIGATALSLEIPVLTLNTKPFHCIPGLLVITPARVTRG